MACLLLELCKCKESQICVFCIQLSVIAIAMVIGALILWQPKRAIAIQIAFYRLINWKMEPISMTKEIRNTRIMAAVILIFATAALIYIIMQR